MREEEESLREGEGNKREQSTLTEMYEGSTMKPFTLYANLKLK